MALDDVANWVPEEMGSQAQVAVQTSAVEKFSRKEPMTSATKQVPATSTIDAGNIGKGGAYAQVDNSDTAVLLTAMKIGAGSLLAEEDLNDANVDVINVKKKAAGTGWAKYFDNAALAVDAAANGTTVPFTSVYHVADTATDAAVRLTQTAGPLTFAHVNGAVTLVEASDFASPEQIVVLAHSSFKGLLRGLVDDQNRPIFLDARGQGMDDTLLGYPVAWTNGAKTNATASSSPSGNPILVVAVRDLLIEGERTPLESQIIPAELSALDEALLKVRKRVGFAVGDYTGVAVVEITAAP